MEQKENDFSITDTLKEGKEVLKEAKEVKEYTKDMTTQDWITIGCVLIFLTVLKIVDKKFRRKK